MGFLKRQTQRREGAKNFIFLRLGDFASLRFSSIRRRGGFEEFEAKGFERSRGVAAGSSDFYGFIEVRPGAGIIVALEEQGCSVVFDDGVARIEAVVFFEAFEGFCAAA